MQIILGLGTNEGDRFAALKTAITKLTPHLKNIIISGIYSSPALLLEDSPPEWNRDFLNMAVIGDTEASPENFLKICQQIETEMGRAKEHAKWSPRIIDIDILLYGEHKVQSETLTIPHAHLHARAFALLPLLELKRGYAKSPPHNGTKRIGAFA